MGKTDVIMRDYLSDRTRFADFFNGVFFQRAPVIKAADLLEASEQYVSDKGKHISSRLRDLKMTLKTGETLRILSLENQTHIDYSMPFRCMEYDSLEYGKQLKQIKQHNKEHKLLHSAAEKLCGLKKTDRLAPVYTLCLYHGEEPWDGPLSLRDMMDFGEDGDGMSRYFADYPFRLFCVNEHTDFHMFHTELREVFTAMTYRRDKDMLYHTLSENPAYQSLDEDTVRVLSVTLDIPKIWDERDSFMHINVENKKEEFDMCQAMRELLADAKAVGVNEGVSQGITQGITQGIQNKTHIVVSNMLKRSMSTEDICALAECSEEFVEKVRAEL